MKRIVGAAPASPSPSAPSPATGQVLPGHRLPEGPERPVRERSYHIEKYVADLRFDMVKEEIAGTATITFQSLREPLATLSLDAARLDVSKVERDGKSLEFRVDPKAWKLDIALGEPVASGQSATVRIAYSCQPRVGMYFFPAAHGRQAQAWNYGEGGLHNGWLPIYNDTNDRFAVEFVVTVPKGYTAVSQRRPRPAEGERGRHAHVSLGPGEADSQLPDDRGRRRARPRAARRREGGSGLGAAGGLDASRDREGGPVAPSATRRRWSSSSRNA